MKTATITCHRAYNYGAVLQTYALQTFLTKRGHESVVIDYAPYYLRKDNNKIKRCLKIILQAHDRIKNRKTFKFFLEKYINLETPTFHTYDEIASCTQKYDLYITGSDQVWNMNMKNGNDDSYFLRFAPKNSKKISYAASLAMDSLTEQQSIRLKTMIGDFRSISVREKSAQQLLKKIGIASQVVSDPVFLLEHEDWDNFASDTEHKDDFVLIYAFYGQKEIYQYARKYASELNCKVYAIGTKYTDRFMGVDKYFWSASPTEFVNLIRKAKAVVTNSFHGLSFSMIYNKPLYVFKTKTLGNSRLIDMLESVGVYENDENSCLIAKVEQYKDINNILSQIKESSKKFLEGCGI